MKALLTNRPVGVAALLSTLAVIVAGQLGLNLSADAVAGIIGGLTSILSILFPRQYQELENRYDDSSTR